MKTRYYLILVVCFVIIISSLDWYDYLIVENKETLVDNQKNVQNLANTIETIQSDKIIENKTQKNNNTSFFPILFILIFLIIIMSVIIYYLENGLQLYKSNQPQAGNQSGKQASGNQSGKKASGKQAGNIQPDLSSQKQKTGQTGQTGQTKNNNFFDRIISMFTMFE